MNPQPTVTITPTLDGLCPVDLEPWSIHDRQSTATCRAAYDRTHPFRDDPDPYGPDLHLDAVDLMPAALTLASADPAGECMCDGPAGPHGSEAVCRDCDPFQPSRPCRAHDAEAGPGTFRAEYIAAATTAECVGDAPAGPRWHGGRPMGATWTEGPWVARIYSVSATDAAETWRSCPHHHRNYWRAMDCADRMARRLNRAAER